MLNNKGALEKSSQGRDVDQVALIRISAPTKQLTIKPFCLTNGFNLKCKRKQRNKANFEAPCLMAKGIVQCVFGVNVSKK